MSGTNAYSQQKLKKIEIELLKNIKHLEIDFTGSELTAIMGVNGSGKSTIIHALACCYKPLENIPSEDYKFNYFFVPNSDALWKGSCFSIYNDYRIGYEQFTDVKVTYTKQKDRWAPRYERRLPRHVSYIGINTCVPAIENEKSKSFIKYVTAPVNDSTAQVIKDKCGVIMNRDYDSYNLHTTKKHKYIGVEWKNVKYSALSMGAGEQRLFDIVREVFNAPKYSLILIDEIDLLLHVTALKRLLCILKERAEEKSLQIVFTTHSPIVLEMKDVINIRYIIQTPEKTLCLEETKPDIIYNLTGESIRPLKIFVEDDLAKTIVKKVCEQIKMLKYVEIREYGSAKNVFTLVSGLLLQSIDIKNMLFVIDGDVYISPEEKQHQINAVLTGDTPHYESLREQALSQITQLNLEEGIKPEKFIHELLKDQRSIEYDEVKEAAADIVSVDNSHKYLDDLIERLGDERSSGLKRIIDCASKNERWENYVQAVREWLESKKKVVL